MVPVPKDRCGGGRWRLDFVICKLHENILCNMNVAVLCSKGFMYFSRAVIFKTSQHCCIVGFGATNVASQKSNQLVIYFSFFAPLIVYIPHFKSLTLFSKTQRLDRRGYYHLLNRSHSDYSLVSFLTVTDVI